MKTGNWKLTITGIEELTDSQRDFIINQIIDGNTEGEVEIEDKDK